MLTARETAMQGEVFIVIIIIIIITNLPSIDQDAVIVMYTIARPDVCTKRPQSKSGHL
jgi:hypothetical protein